MLFVPGFPPAPRGCREITDTSTGLQKKRWEIEDKQSQQTSIKHGHLSMFAGQYKLPGPTSTTSSIIPFSLVLFHFDAF